MICMGKELVDLVEMFIVCNIYEEKVDCYVCLYGNLNFGQGGVLLDVIDMYGKYGVVFQFVYVGLNYGYDYNCYGEMEVIFKGMFDVVIVNKNK